MKKSSLARKTPLKRGSWSRKSSPLPEQAPAKAIKSRVKKPTVAEGSKYLSACRGERCYLRVPFVCPENPNDETVVPCHENSLSAGKGMGLKSSHERTVPGCFWCHAWLDQGKAERWQKTDVFLMAITEWIPVRARKMGIVTEELEVA